MLLLYSSKGNGPETGRRDEMSTLQDLKDAFQVARQNKDKDAAIRLWAEIEAHPDCPKPKKAPNYKGWENHQNWQTREELAEMRRRKARKGIPA